MAVEDLKGPVFCLLPSFKFLCYETIGPLYYSWNVNHKTFIFIAVSIVGFFYFYRGQFSNSIFCISYSTAMDRSEKVFIINQTYWSTTSCTRDFNLLWLVKVAEILIIYLRLVCGVSHPIKYSLLVSPDDVLISIDYTYAQFPFFAKRKNRERQNKINDRKWIGLRRKRFPNFFSRPLSPYRKFSLTISCGTFTLLLIYRVSKFELVY